MQALRHVLVDDLDQLHGRPSRRRRGLLSVRRMSRGRVSATGPQRVEDLRLPLLSVADVFLDLGFPVGDHGAVAGVGAAGELVLHCFEAAEVGG